MKKIVIFLIVCVFSLSTYAQRIDINTAKQAGKTFLIAKTHVLRQKNMINLRLAYQSQSEQKAGDAHTYYYVFNIDSGGFIIVSGSRNTIPVLAYSTTNTFDPNNIPPNMAGVLNLMQEDIRYAMENQLSASEKISSQWNELISGRVAVLKATCSTISPLLGSLSWGQAPYYNDSCPYDAPENELCVTGCVATAMAQIIKYWEYPANGFGSHCYYADFSSEGYGDYGLQCADFKNTTYHYDIMPDQLSSGSTSAERSAVAQLMYHCGVSVQMRYSPNESGAYSILDDYWIGQGDMDARTAFKTFWGYTKADGLYKTDYTDSEWKNLLKEQLNKRQPVFYAGSSTSGAGGHAFVCDGYDANDFFHFNWGWNGAYDCYCPIDSLCPGGIGTGGGYGNYSSNQRAVINLRGENEEKSLGWVSATDHVHMPTTTGNISYEEYYLLPDTCLRAYTNIDNRTAASWHAIGSIFNPYSETFGEDNIEHLFAKSAPYRLDTLQIIAGYLLGNTGYNEIHPDTLRVYLSYYEPYNQIKLDTDYKALHYSSFPYQSLLSPKVIAYNTSQQKGCGIKPITSNTITIDYILTKEDTSVIIWDSTHTIWSYYYSTISIPLRYNNSTINGFEIPAGAVLGTMIKFIPGYDYQNNDTLYYGNVTNSYWDDTYPKYKNNAFKISYLYSTSIIDFMDNANAFNNGALIEYSHLRYQTNHNYLDSCYYPNTYINPRFYYHISYNTNPTSSRTDIDTAVCESFEWDDNILSTDGDYKFTYTDIHGNDSIIWIHLNVDAPPAEIDTLTGETEISQTGNYTYSIPSVEGAENYKWSISNPNWNITSISDTAVILNISEYGRGYLNVKAYSKHKSCETETSIVINYCLPLGEMENIQGDDIIHTSGNYSYSIDSVENADYYTWELLNASWSFTGNTSGTSIQLYIDKAEEGTLIVKAYDLCGDYEERELFISSDVNILTTDQLSEIIVSPNPAEDKVTIHIPHNIDYSLQVVDTYGKSLYLKKSNNTETSIDLSSFASGIYFLQIKSNKQIINTYKLIKK